MINKLAKAIKIQTTADVNDENMPKLHKLFETEFPKLFSVASVKKIENSLLIEIKGADKTLKPIMFCGHMDVVSANASEWINPPFDAIIDDKFLWGRGAIDCKNVVVGLLCAAQNILNKGFLPKRTIYLAFGHDEEIGGMNGAFNIVKHLKEQGITLDMVLDEGGHVSTDFLGDKNYATIALAEKSILRLKFISKSQGGHAAYIKEKTALYNLSKALIAIEENPMPIKIIPLMQKYIDTLAINYPQLVENYEHKPENNPYVRTTIAPTMIEASNAPNILPSSPYFVCDIRILPEQTFDEIMEHIKNLVKDFNIEIEVLSKPINDSKATDFNSNYYKMLENLIKDKFDDAIVVPALMAGGTDARHYEEICDVVLRFMPTLMTKEIYSTLHTANERIEVNSFNKQVDFYEEFITKVANQ